MKFALYVILIYIVLATAAFLLQRRLLYFPDRTRPSETLVQANGLAFWPAPDEGYRGLISVGWEEYPNGTIIVFHGNAGRAVDRGYYARALEPLGYRVLLAEYPGYGGREGKPSEGAFVADAQETVELAYSEFGSPLFLWGESLGCGVAAAVAADPSISIAAVVLVTPWDSLPALAQTLYWYLPARWFVLDKFDNVKALRSYAGPVAVALAERDEVIPIRHGLKLYESMTGPKRLWTFENAGHNSWPVQPEASWWKEVTAFISGGG